MNGVSLMSNPVPPVPGQVTEQPPVQEESLERLEARICSQAAHIAASTCGWLQLVAEFERRKGWAQWGLKSCAHWLSWACSVSAQAAREYLRVAKALETAPLIQAAFATGKLSYSKVKVITRVVGLVPEQTLLDQALLHTAAQLQRVVRAFRKTDSAGPGQQRSRSARWFWDDDGMFVITARLPPDEGGILLAALRSSEQSLDRPLGCADLQPAQDQPAQDQARQDSEQAGWSTADALMAMAQNALAAGPVDSSGDDRHLLVLHVDAEVLGGPRDDSTPGVGPEPGVDLDRLRRCHLEDGPGVARSTVERLICDTAAVAVVRSGLGPLLKGEPLRLGRRTRKISSGLRRALRVRDGGCQYPGCPRRRHLEAHHVVHWKDGGPTNLENLVLVCRFHHMQVHEGGFTVGFAGPVSRGATSSGWVFHRPDGVAVPAVRIMVAVPHEIGDVETIVDEEMAQSRLGDGFSLADSVGVFCRAADGPSEIVRIVTGSNAEELFPDPPVAQEITAVPRPAAPPHVWPGEELINSTDFTRFDTFDEIMAFCRAALFAPQGAR